MAKKSKQQRRYERQRREAKEANLELFVLRSRYAVQSLAMDDLTKRLHQKTDQLNRLMAAVKDVAANSTALPVTTRERFCRQMRIPIADRRPWTLGQWDAERLMREKPIQPEEVATMVIYEEELREALRRHIHLQIYDAPGGGNLHFAYAISHTAMRSIISPQHWAEIICREFGATIFNALNK
jgi:hypothetical protein